jgi:hypothetical protein
MYVCCEGCVPLDWDQLFDKAFELNERAWLVELDTAGVGKF